MSDVSLLTIVSGRKEKLNNLLRGVAEQSCPPREVVIVFMNEEPATELADPGCPVYLHTLDQPEHRLPLAAARNLAASVAKGEILAFLDVDCIPHPDYLDELERAVCLTCGLVMGDLRYLEEGAAGPGWTYPELDLRSQPHPRRPQLEEGERLMPLPYDLFWSLSFGLRAVDFARLGAFDQKYTGYGGEDTDFAYTARQIGLPLYACPAKVYHQYHPSYSPPYNHLKDIVTNARRFHEKWQVWPMEGWLKQFEKDGYIDWREDGIEILREVDEQTIEQARSVSPFG